MLTQSQATVSIICFERSSLFAGVLGVSMGALPVFLVCPPPLLHYLEAKKEGFDDSGPEKYRTTTVEMVRIDQVLQAIQRQNKALLSYISTPIEFSWNELITRFLLRGEDHIYLRGVELPTRQVVTQLRDFMALFSLPFHHLRN